MRSNRRLNVLAYLTFPHQQRLLYPIIFILAP